MTNFFHANFILKVKLLIHKSFLMIRCRTHVGPVPQTNKNPEVIVVFSSNILSCVIEVFFRQVTRNPYFLV